jgi:hypothetical protein
LPDAQAHYLPTDRLFIGIFSAQIQPLFELPPVVLIASYALLGRNIRLRFI